MIHSQASFVRGTALLKENAADLGITFEQLRDRLRETNHYDRFFILAADKYHHKYLIRWLNDFYKKTYLKGVLL